MRRQKRNKPIFHFFNWTIEVEKFGGMVFYPPVLQRI
jgi:hypothetical protein